MDENSRYTDPPKRVPSVAEAWGCLISFAVLAVLLFLVCLDVHPAFRSFAFWVLAMVGAILTVGWVAGRDE